MGKIASRARTKGKGGMMIICWLFRRGPILSARIVNEARYAHQACQR